MRIKSSKFIIGLLGAWVLNLCLPLFGAQNPLDKSAIYGIAQAEPRYTQIARYCAGLLRPVTIRNEAAIESLKILSYNVENLFASTGKYELQENGEYILVPEKGPAPKSEEHVKQIRRIILESNADILVLTEIEGLAALQELATRQLIGKYRAIHIEGNDSRGIGIGFLIKKDLPWETRIVSHKHLRWIDPVTKKEMPLFTRDLPVLEFRRHLVDRDPLFVVIGNHAKSQRDRAGDPKSTRLRTAQYKAAAAITEAYVKKDVPIIFAGDFNSDIQSDKVLDPIKPYLTSSLEIAPDRVAPEDRVTHTYHKGEKTELSQLDDVMVSSQLLNSVISSQILRYKDASGQLLPYASTHEARSLQPSDHFPVLTEISTEELFRR